MEKKQKNYINNYFAPMNKLISEIYARNFGITAPYKEENENKGERK